MTRSEPLERYALDADTLCWLWTGRRDMKGYGKVTVGDKQWLAHRLFYAEHVGGLQAETPLHHLCDVRHCVNPWHLVQLTHEQHIALHPTSVAQAIRKSAEKRRARTHCANGHEWTDANTHIRPDGSRQCRTCGREKQARYLERRNRHEQS